jgi:uncharacterized membrane protein
MKRNYINIVIMCTILMLNIVFTQYMVHHFFYQNFVNVLIFAGLNVLLFPFALFLYKKEFRKPHEK